MPVSHQYITWHNTTETLTFRTKKVFINEECNKHFDTNCDTMAKASRKKTGILQLGLHVLISSITFVAQTP